MFETLTHDLLINQPMPRHGKGNLLARLVISAGQHLQKSFHYWVSNGKLRKQGTFTARVMQASNCSLTADCQAGRVRSERR
jgi:hypothetical protein